jgi:hypothetical protein
MSVQEINGTKIHISSPQGSYYCSVRHIIVVQKIAVLKNMEFRLKNQRGLAIGFTEKHIFTTKWAKNSILSP